MAKAEVIVPVNESFLENRQNSFDNHVNRIREANSKRQLVPSWESIKKTRSSEKFKGERLNRRISISELQRRSVHAHCCESTASVDKLHLNESKKKLERHNLASNKSSLDFMTEATLSQQPDASNENLMIQTKTDSKLRKKREMNLKNITKEGVLERQQSSQVNHANRIRSASSKRHLVRRWERIKKKRSSEKSVPVNERVSRSVVDHANRIRSANSYRKLVPSWERKRMVETGPSENSEGSVSKRITTLSEFPRMSCYTQHYGSTDSLEKSHVKESNKKRLERNKPTSSRQPDAPNKNLVIQEKTDNKSIPEKKIEMNLEKKKAKNNVRKGVKNIQTIQNSMIPVANTKKTSKRISKEQNKKEEIGENYMRKNTSDAKESSMKKGSEAIRRLEEKNIPKNNQSAGRKSDIESSESAEKKINFAHIDSNDETNEYESEEKINAPAEKLRIIREVPDVEMHASEKLQIIMNLKSLSPDDAAILIYLDNLPESVWKRDYHRSLSLSPIEDTDLPQETVSALKTHSGSF